MKKTFILLAASAMLLAACNKEEITNGYTIQGDKITFGVGVDNIQGEGKQSFNSNYGRIWFDSRGISGDQILVNGTACPVVPVASSSHPGSSASHSPLATVTADLSASGAYDFVYPARKFTWDASGQYRAHFLQSNSPALYDGRTYEIYGAGYTDYDCLWPMYAGINDLASFSGKVQLRNACAFLSPRFSYGPQWANVVFSPLTGRTYGTASDACPSMIALNGFLISNQKIWGPAHLDCTNPNHPVMIMDQTVASGNRDFISFATEYLITNVAPKNITCILPIAPIENSNAKEFQIVQSSIAHIDQTDEYIWLIFYSNTSTTTSQIERNNQYMLDINFATAADGTFTYLPSETTHTAEAYAAAVRSSSGATIQFSNGTLFVTNNQNVVMSTLGDIRSALEQTE